MTLRKIGTQQVSIFHIGASQKFGRTIMFNV